MLPWCTGLTNKSCFSAHHIPPFLLLPLLRKLTVHLNPPPGAENFTSCLLIKPNKPSTDKEVIRGSSHIFLFLSYLALSVRIT